MPTTSNFGWTTPADTDLVKDGAAAIRTLGNGIDTSFLDLKGGTTGQVLSKASNTDLDFSWVAQDDSNAIQNAIVDAKGDLISATAADTPARLAVGANGTVLTADSAEATGLKWATPSAGGGLTLISTTSMSGSATISLTSLPTTYKSLYLIIRGLQNPTTGSLSMRFNNVTTNPSHVDNGSLAGSGTDRMNVSDSIIGGNSRAQISIVTVSIPDYQTSGITKALNSQFWIATNTTDGYGSGEKYWNSNITGAITSIQIFTSNNNYSAGTVLLYGVN